MTFADLVRRHATPAVEFVRYMVGADLLRDEDRDPSGWTFRGTSATRGILKLRYMGSEWIAETT